MLSHCSSADHLADPFVVDMDESMSPSDSLKSPDVEYMDRSAVYVNLDNQQHFANFAYDIYKHLRASEEKKRPATDLIEKVQIEINATWRAILVDWLVQVAGEYLLVPETLYLAVNYMDRYLSGKVMFTHNFQLLGVACMLIASKYEEKSAPELEELCDLTDNQYNKDQVLQMESDILNYLKFDMTVPTTKCFLRLFVYAEQGNNAEPGLDENPLVQLECLSDYIAELSLQEYHMLCFAPSLIAASSIFLAKFILLPSEKPWNSTLHQYTYYHSSDLRECVMALHNLCCNSPSSTLPSIREKYSQEEYQFVAEKYCPPSIPGDFFDN